MVLIAAAAKLLNRLFDEIDEDGSGQITFAECKRHYQAMHEQSWKLELDWKTMRKRVDTNKDEKISKKEWLRYYMKKFAKLPKKVQQTELLDCLTAQIQQKPWAERLADKLIKREKESRRAKREFKAAVLAGKDAPNRLVKGSSKVAPDQHEGKKFLGITVFSKANWDKNNVPHEKELNTELQRMLADNSYYGLPGTDGSFFSNLLWNTLYDHKIFSLFFAHELHPFSSGERAVFLWNSVCWLLLCSAVIHTMALGSMIETLIVSFLTIPYDYLLRMFLECGCFVACPGIMEYCDGLGHSIAVILSIASIIQLVVGIVVGLQAGVMYLATFGISLLFSFFVVQLLVAYLKAVVFYGSDKQKFQEEFGGLFPKDEPPTSISEVAMYVRNNAPIEQVLIFNMHYRITEFDISNNNTERFGSNDKRKSISSGAGKFDPNSRRYSEVLDHSNTIKNLAAVRSDAV